LSVLTGGDLLGDIVGIIAGHIYYYLKDIVPVTFKKDYLITPNFVKRYLDNPRLFQPRANLTNYSSGGDGRAANDEFRNRWGNSNNASNNNSTGGGSSSGSGFQAFSGRGTTLG